VAAVCRIGSLDRARVRAEFERRFTVERMAHDYLEIYRAVAPAGARAAAPLQIRPRTSRSQAARSVPADLVAGSATNASKTISVHP
jgi:hypothetical protein